MDVGPPLVAHRKRAVARRLASGRGIAAIATSGLGLAAVLAGFSPRRVEASEASR